VPVKSGYVRAWLRMVRGRTGDTDEGLPVRSCADMPSVHFPFEVEYS